MPEAARFTRSGAALALGVAVVAFLPFVNGLARGDTFYFRDLSRHLFPMRLFALSGLGLGHVPFWNPYIHEGEPLLPSALSYPFDLLHLLAPNAWGLSFALALHVPLAALTFLALARALGLRWQAAACGALVYALGGFTLSCLNLYFFLQAVAWAPLLVLTFKAAADGRAREMALGALVLAVSLSTLGIEIVAQALLLSVVLTIRRGGLGQWARIGGAALLGAALAAPTLLVFRDAVASGVRAQGFSTYDAFAFSLHPVAFVQTVVAGLFGEPARLTSTFWGSRFTPGFPYFLSLYLGLGTLLVAGVGAACGRLPRARLVVTGVLAAAVCLGPHARLDLVTQVLPFLGSFRSPVKAFFLVHFVVSLLCAAGIDSLVTGNDDRGWRILRRFGAPLALLLIAAPAVPWALPTLTQTLASHFFAPDFVAVGAATRSIAVDAATAGVVTLCIVLIVMVRSRLGPRHAASAIVALIAADLLRAGAALNPMTSVTGLRASSVPESIARIVQAGGGRLFTCEPAFSATFHRVTATVPSDRDLWTIRAYSETLVPAHNMPLRVPTAYSRDLGGIVPPQNTLQDPRDLGCADVGRILERLRGAGVTHMISFVPLDVPGLKLLAEAAPQRAAPLRFYVHGVETPLPLRAVAAAVEPARGREEAEQIATRPGFQESGRIAVEAVLTVSGARGSVVSRLEASDRIELEVEADRPTALIVRDSHAPGWTATVNGDPAPVWRANGRHRAVPVPQGRSRVVLQYRPPSLRLGLVVGAVAALIACALALRPSFRTRDDEPTPSASGPEPAG